MAENAYPLLFSSLDLGGCRLRNRLAHASIVTRYVHDGEPTQRLLDYLGNRARGGAAMIVTEPLALLRWNPNPDRLRAWDDRGSDGLKRVVEAVEKHDTRLLGQLQDPGRGRHAVGRNEEAIGASALPDDLSWTVPRVLESAEIRALVEEWADGARRLRDCGFSGIEISAGHGHLFHQFLSPRSNRREDEYGGTIDGRSRLLRELIGAIRDRCGRPFVIGVKLPAADGLQGSIDAAEAQRIARVVAATGEVDYWTFVHGAHGPTLYQHLPGARGPRAPYLEDIRLLRAAAPGVATGAIGYITDPNEAERALGDGTADLVFLGRQLITDAAWGEKARTGREREIRHCVTCNSCWKSVVEGNALRCDNNPRVGESDEADWRPALAARRRRVVVVGAGIAGLEAAWVAAARGHEVTVLGASPNVGGKTRLHAGLPGGANLASIYDYQYAAAVRHGARFDLGVTADAATVHALAPDVVVLATGSSPARPQVVPRELHDQGLVQDLRSFVGGLRPRARREAGRAVIIDGDHTEMTYAAAELLAGIFERVTIVTPRERIAGDCALVNRQEIYRRLYECRVEIIACAEPVNLSGLENGLLEVGNVFNGETAGIADVAALSYAGPRVPDDGLLRTLRAAGIEVHAVGDCRAPRSVLAATREGHAAGLLV